MYVLNLLNVLDGCIQRKTLSISFLDPRYHNLVSYNKHFSVQYPDFHDLRFFSFFLTDGLVVCHLPFGPTAYFTLYNVVMRHDVPDIGTMSEAYPHLIFHNFSSRLGRRVRKCWTMFHACDTHIVFHHLFVQQLINSACPGIQYPQVSLSSAKGRQQTCNHIRQPRRLYFFQVSEKACFSVHATEVALLKNIQQLFFYLQTSYLQENRSQEC